MKLHFHCDIRSHGEYNNIIVSQHRKPIFCFIITLYIKTYPSHTKFINVHFPKKKKKKIPKKPTNESKLSPRLMKNILENTIEELKLIFGFGIAHSCACNVTRKRLNAGNYV